MEKEMDFSEAMMKLQRLFNKEAYAELRAAIFSKIDALEAENTRLKQKISDQGWIINPDRMGGQFSDWEINRKGDEWS